VKSLPDWDQLSLAEQVAQMVVVRASGYLFDHQIQYPAWEPPAAKLRYWLQELGVGGVLLLGGSAGELALRSQQLQDWAKIPLLIAADIEEGVGQRFGGATWFAPPMAIGAIAQKNEQQAQLYAEQMGATTAQEALAIGINWILAPVVDVNNNPQNPVINVRAFGDTPQAVGKLARAFIRGTQQYPVLSTAKHFPGHGDTATDSHLELPVLPHDLSRLHQVELPPFAEAIASGVDAVMSAHLLIPALDKQLPATLSKQVLTDLLRLSWGFEGLIVTDALVMGAIANRYGANEAPVMALEAGADILLMPVNPEGAIQAVCEAVATGRISRERIQESLERIWKAKSKVIGEQSSSSKSHTPICVDQLAQPEALTTVTNMLRESQQSRGSLHLATQATNSTEKPRNLIVVDDILACDFLNRHTPAVTIPRQLGYELQLIDHHTPLISSQLSDPLAARPTLLQLFIRGNPFRGSAGLTPEIATIFKKLLRNPALQALVIYGSPYAFEQFIPDLLPEQPYVFSFGQMPQAQLIALEALLPKITTVNVLTPFL